MHIKCLLKFINMRCYVRCLILLIFLAETSNCNYVAGAHDSGCRKHQLRVISVKQAKAKKSHS